MDPSLLVNEAWDLMDGGRHAEAIAMVRRALEIDAGEIDGYVILALLAPTAAERCSLLREGMRIGEIRYKAWFRRPSHHYFWSDMATRPYMRAVYNLILELWNNDPADRDEAVRLGGHLLRINPNDNQGIRFLLLEWLPKLNRWNEMIRLLRRCRGEDRFEIAYWSALVAFREGSPDANAVLAAAMEINPHVPAMLTGRKPRPPAGELVAYRGEDVASAYAARAHDVWNGVAGARNWLRRRTNICQPGL